MNKQALEIINKYQNSITDIMELSHIFLVDYNLMYYRLKDLGLL